MTYINRAIEDILKNGFETAKSIAITGARQDSNMLFIMFVEYQQSIKPFTQLYKEGIFYEIKEN